MCVSVYECVCMCMSACMHAWECGCLAVYVGVLYHTIYPPVYQHRVLFCILAVVVNAATNTKDHSFLINADFISFGFLQSPKWDTESYDALV